MVGRKISPKDEWRSQYKWAKVYGNEMVRVKERLENIEKILGIETKDKDKAENDPT